MFKAVICVAVVSALAGSSLAAYDGVGVITQNAYSSGSGGEFTIRPTSGFIGVTGLFADLSTSTFESFCVEVNEHFSPGGSYNMNINTVSILGGSGGPSYPLQPATAFLYWNFRNGTLAGFDYSAAGRQNSSGSLQAAIWFLQGNQPGGANNGFVSLANAAISGNLWQGIGDVRILNVYDGNNGLSQDQLTIIPHPLPTPGGAALLGAGLVVANRRRSTLHRPARIGHRLLSAARPCPRGGSCL
jgi:hypothetical protein